MLYMVNGYMDHWLLYGLMINGDIWIYIYILYIYGLMIHGQ
jgi:hypothetical protein